MPNYSLVIDSTFQPFTYQELTAPLDRAEAYHERLAQEYDNLSSQADLLKLLGDNEEDRNSGAYKRYQAYSDSLKNEAENLYRHGLNVESRRRLSDMRRAYNTDIVPIQNAYNKREEEAKAQQAMRNQGINVLFTRDAANTSIDEYLANPLGGYGTVNLDNITKDMYTVAKELEGQIRGGRVEGIDPYTAYHISQHGLDANIITDWLNDPSKSPTLTAMMNQVLEKNGVNAEYLKNSPNRDLIIGRGTKAAQLGAWGAIGEDKGQMMELFGPRQDRRDASEINNYIRKKKIDGTIASQQAVRNEGNIPLFFDKIQSYSPDGKPVQMNALELRYDNNKKVLTDNLIPRLLMTDDKTFIREIESIDSNGVIKPKDKYIKDSEFVDDKGNAKAQPLFYRINSPGGSNNIIMRYGTKSYLIPGDRLGDIFGDSNVDVNRMKALYDEKQRLISKYGEEGYWSNPYHADLENGLNNAGAASVRAASTAIAGRYTSPSYTLTQSSEDKLE